MAKKDGGSKPPCIIAGCEKPQASYGFCSYPHYRKLFRLVKVGIITWADVDYKTLGAEKAAKVARDAIIAHPEIANKPQTGKATKAKETKETKPAPEVVADGFTTCLKKGCNDEPDDRGVCKKHLKYYSGQVAKGTTSWAKLEKDGVVFPTLQAEGMPVPKTASHPLTTEQVEEATKAVGPKKKASKGKPKKFSTPEQLKEYHDKLEELPKAKVENEQFTKIEVLEDEGTLYVPKKPTDKMFVYGLKNRTTGELVRDAVGANWQEAAASIGWKPEDVLRFYPLRVAS